MTAESKAGLLEQFPALRRLERLKQRRIPEIRQMSVTDCGAACLAMVLGYYGREVGIDDVRQVLGSSRDGISARTLLAAGRRLGLRGRGISLDLNRLSYLAPGAVLHWDFSHYVVFEKLGKGSVHLVDPALGRREVTLEQFGQHFTGVALLFEPTEDFQPGTSSRSPYRYLLPVLRQSDTLARIVVMSAALQLFSMAVPLLMGLIVDKVVPRGDYHLLLVVAAGLAGIVVFQLLSALIRSHLLLELRARVDSGMKLGFLEHLTRLAYPFFQLRPAGDLMMRLNLQSTVREMLSSAAISSVLDGALVLLYLGVVLLSDALMGMLVLGLGLLQVLILLGPRRLQRSLLSQSLELEARSQNYQLGLLTGMQTFKAFGVEERMVQNYSNLYVDVLNVELARGRLSAWMDSLASTLRLASPLVLLSVGAWRVLEGELTLGVMLSLNALATALLVPLSNLLGTGGQLLLLGSYLERINDVLDTPPEQTQERAGVSVALKGAIELQGVSFRYGPMSPEVVQGVSVKIEPGQMVAIVGRSGAGKSTLANLLLGLYTPTAGRVLYDGLDLRELDLREVRNQVGIVLQDPFFLESTVRDNITLGEPGLTLDPVVEAARAADVHEEIMAMPMQYNTPIAGRGLSLSGGQRQRLALARALVRKPSILLLDEATSALDSISEGRVQEALERLRCTRIVIAHRLSTIRRADLILVMEAGRIVESGTHEELLSRHGAYEQLVRGQMERLVRAAS